MHRSSAWIFGVIMFAVASPAGAAVTYDTSLAAPPGVYFGSGNPNNHYTVSTGNGIEIGLTAVQRFVGNYTPTLDVYNVATGPTSVPGKTGADWGVSFSVNLNNTLKLSDITTVFSLQDVGLGTSGSFDALAIPDNAQYDGVTTCSSGPCVLPNAFAFQNSEALSFAAIAAAFGDPGYNMNANDTYIFSLSVFNQAGALLGTNSITVVAGAGASVPEPLTLSLFGAGLVGAMAARRRKA